MMPSEPLSTKSSIKIPNWLIVAFFVVSLVGFLDATFLTIEHYRGVVPPCSVLNGCEKVTTSEYATVGPLPLSLLGSIYYGVLLLLTVAYFDMRKTGIMRLTAAGTVVGLVASSYFVYLQLAVIQAICLYCMISAISSFLLFGLGIMIWRKLQT